jgi:signal transduction histidine kinase
MRPIDINFDLQLSTAIFRILQKILANIKEEAIATSVRISLKKKIDKLYIKVIDNGNETTPAQILDHLPFRLMEIFERAHIFGIEINTTGKINGGNTITLSIPLN